jgi:hypothetical protein
MSDSQMPIVEKALVKLQAQLPLLRVLVVVVESKTSISKRAYSITVKRENFQSPQPPFTRL